MIGTFAACCARVLAQTDRGCHAALSRSIALRVVIIFRMTATMMTLDFLSAAARLEGFEGGTVTACAEGGHVEDVTDRHPTTVDAAVSLELAAVEVIWREADEGGDLFAAHLPEFWQQGDEREGQHRADTWHRGQQFIALSESNIGGNHLGQALVEEADIGLQSRLAAFAEPP